MNYVTIKYLGKEYQYPLLTIEEMGEDWIIDIRSYEFSIQGFELCYNDSKKFHFVTTKQDFLSKMSNQEIWLKKIRDKSNLKSELDLLPKKFG